MSDGVADGVGFTAEVVAGGIAVVADGIFV